MKALVKSKPEPGIWAENVDRPVIGPNDVLIEIRKAAMCGTDLHIYNWDHWASKTIPVPLTIGHEFCGVVAEIGDEVEGLQPGDRVSGEGHINCGYCRNCRAGRRHLCRNSRGIGVQRAGAFAEFLAMPAKNVFPLPDSIADDVASILDPLGNATHAALSFDLVGEDVLITGAGPVGLMTCAVARHVGARHVVITDVNDYRLGIAKKMGASRVVNSKRESLDDVMSDLKMKEGFDVGLEMSGNANAFRDMLRTLHHGGRVALLGIPPDEIAIDWNEVIFKGLIIKGIYGREMFETWYKMAAMLESGLDVTPVITHHFPAREFQSAFDSLKTGQAGKVILDWSQT